MIELRNINLSLLLLIIFGCQNKRNDIQFIKNKELISKIDETIEFIDTKLGDECKYVSIKLLKDKEGNEYIRIQSEIDLNHRKVFFQEIYRGKLIVVYEASDSLLNKYFYKEYKVVSEKHNLDDKIGTYEPKGYIYEVLPKNIVIVGIIGYKIPKEIESYSNGKIQFIPPKTSLF